MTLIQSSGQLAAVAPPNRPVGGAGGLRLFEEYADYAAIWRTQPMVRRVVSFKARNIAQLGLHVFRRDGESDRTRLRPADHGLAATLAKPNPWTTPYRSIFALESDIAIYDRALWVKFRADDGSGRVALVRVPPPRWSPIGGSWMSPEGFEIRGSRGKVVVPFDGAVYFPGYDPEGETGGVAPMESLRQVIAEERAASDYRENMWRNGARMEHVITRPVEAPKMSDTAKERFWARWNAQYTGSAGSAKTALLEEGMDVKPMSFSAKDAQYTEARKLNLAEVAGFFHILPQSIGILDNANYSNMESAHKQLYQDTLGPDLVAITQDIELGLVHEFDAPDSGVYCEFNLAEKMKGSFAEQARSIQTLVGGPVLTRNEGRALLNRPAIEGADELITPLNVVEGGQASPTDSAPPGQPDEIGDPGRPDPSEDS